MGIVSALNSPDNEDRYTIAARPNIANAPGSGAGNPVTTAVTFEDRYGNGTLPRNYSVMVMPSQACAVSVSGKSNSGFNVTLSPPADATLEAGTFDVIVLGPAGYARVW